MTKGVEGSWTEKDKELYRNAKQDLKDGKATIKTLEDEGKTV